MPRERFKLAPLSAASLRTVEVLIKWAEADAAACCPCSREDYTRPFHYRTGVVNMANALRRRLEQLEAKP